MKRMRSVIVNDKGLQSFGISELDDDVTLPVFYTQSTATRIRQFRLREVVADELGLTAFYAENEYDKQHFEWLKSKALKELGRDGRTE